MNTCTYCGRTVTSERSFLCDSRGCQEVICLGCGGVHGHCPEHEGRKLLDLNKLRDEMAEVRAELRECRRIQERINVILERNHLE